MNQSNSLNIICLESKAFYALVEEVIKRVNSNGSDSQERWIDDKQTMSILKISSKTTLQKYRDDGKIRFSQIGKKVILYDRDSINDFIESNSHDTF